ncbi:unnamed protein product [Larinioides sclopetarius]|uniref:Importin N-terminal domain-containing protein n=1 Tax=Larinioides sclopetarius TaxID=280406 RepID=A0AAV1YSZ7_9ARAC
MADEQDLAQLEVLCKQFYDSSNPEERATAEKALVNFVHVPDCLPTCRLLLERGDSSYAQLLAATTLTKLVSRNPQTLTLQQRIEIKNYVLSYLANCPKLATFVTQALVQLFARLTKIGWFETYKKEHVFRNIITQLSGFLQGSVEYCVIGVQLLSQVTCEINQISEAEANKSLTKQRKTATSFRDTELYEIFQLACDMLRRALENWKTPSFKDEVEHNLMNNLLRLAYNCISFDFIGTSPDESSDDLFTVQIPTSWRPAFLDFNSLQLFFDLYHCLPPGLSSMGGTTRLNKCSQYFYNADVCH